MRPERVNVTSGLELTIVSSFRKPSKFSGSAMLAGSGFFEINAHSVLLATLTNQKIRIVQNCLLTVNMQTKTRCPVDPS